MLRSFVIAALLLSPAVAVAQSPTGPQMEEAESSMPPKRIRSVTLTGDEACPPSTSEEVVVCARINPDEQYRIPKAMRDPVEPPAQNQSWVNRAATMDEVGRVAGGLPDTCSPVGTGGQSGCSLARARAFSAERRAARREEALVPGGPD